MPLNEPPRWGGRENLRQKLRRYLILAVSTLTLALLAASAHAFNFTLICFRPIDPSKLTVIRDSDAIENQVSKLAYVKDHRAWLFLADPIGIAMGIGPFVFLLSTFDTRTGVAFYGALSILSSLFFPLCHAFGFWPLFCCRCAQNFALGCSLPLMGRIAVEWSVGAAKARFYAILSSHVELALMVVYPSSGILCNSLRWTPFLRAGWPLVHYALAVATLFAVTAFCALYEDQSPMTRAHSLKNTLASLSQFKSTKMARLVKFCFFGNNDNVSKVEPAATISVAATDSLRLQTDSATIEKASKFSPPPIWAILSEPCIWTNGFVMCGAAFAYSLVVLLGPAYLHISAMMFVLIACGIWGVKNVWGVVTAFSAMLVFGGVAQTLVGVNTQLISLHYSFISMGLLYFISNIFTVCLPAFVYFILSREDRPYQWATLYFIITAVLGAAMSIFVINAESTPLSWALNGNGERRDFLLDEFRSKKNLPPPLINITHHHVLLPADSGWAGECFAGTSLTADEFTPTASGSAPEGSPGYYVALSRPSIISAEMGGRTLALNASQLASNVLNIPLSTHILSRKSISTLSAKSQLPPLNSGSTIGSSQNFRHFHLSPDSVAANEFFRNRMDSAVSFAKNATQMQIPSSTYCGTCEELSQIGRRYLLENFVPISTIAANADRSPCSCQSTAPGGAHSASGDGTTVFGTPSPAVANTSHLTPFPGASSFPFPSPSSLVAPSHLTSSSSPASKTIYTPTKVDVCISKNFQEKRIHEETDQPVTANKLQAPNSDNVANPSNITAHSFWLETENWWLYDSQPNSSDHMQTSFEFPDKTKQPETKKASNLEEEKKEAKLRTFFS